jgi:hypothetical protein
MKLSPVPNLQTRGQLALAAVFVWLLSCATLLLAYHPHLDHALGDPDDALRLTMVRDLLNGRGWFDQKLIRMQPPMGVYMHWSRLIDGGEAALDQGFGAILPPAQAEMAMRITWPLLWLLPAFGSVLLIARRLGGGRAVFLTAVSVTLSASLSAQFLPGRIDHHNVQIVFCLMAFAAAVQAPTAGSIITCALASALGLAIGLEALPFYAAIGAALSLCWAYGRIRGRSATLYGVTLAFSAFGLCALQTPPSRWLTPVCDALAVNLVAALMIAGLGLAGCARFGEGLSRAGRLAGLAVVGAIAVGAYFGLHPLCIKGPLAELDPQLQSVWLAHVREMMTWPELARGDPAVALALSAPIVSGLAGWAWLGLSPERRTQFSWLLTGGLLLASVAMAWHVIRIAEYAIWFSAPLIGAALASVAPSSILSRMIPAAVALIAINVTPGWFLNAIAGASTAQALRSSTAPVSSADGIDPCFDTQALQPLASLPPGIVLSEIDAGPYILAASKDSVLAAPYHRMSWGMLQSRALLSDTPAAAQAALRGRNIAYVLNCPSHAGVSSDRLNLPKTGLQFALDQGRIPDWLQPLSPPKAAMQIYRVRPLSAH